MIIIIKKGFCLLIFLGFLFSKDFEGERLEFAFRDRNRVTSLIVFLLVESPDLEGFSFFDLK